MSEFQTAFNKTELFEGGYANISGDNGGETYMGISRKFNPNWGGWAIIDRNKPIKYNARINDPSLLSLVKQFYYKNYWTKISGDLIEHQKIANFIYDYSVHSGTGRAIKKLQAALGVIQDGKIGSITLSKVNNAPPNFIKILVQERVNFLTYLSTKPNQAKFKAGWLRRVNAFL